MISSINLDYTDGAIYLRLENLADPFDGEAESKQVNLTKIASAFNNYANYRNYDDDLTYWIMETTLDGNSDIGAINKIQWLTEGPNQG
mmetsp:Transcript_6779/g.10908  ORF Transcript_6779/g.10908 Transcript_6779/m.10908 type:complete len:88 (+) Transcript_6779:2730-2993(+)